MPNTTAFIDGIILGICFVVIGLTAFAWIFMWTAQRQIAQPIPCGVPELSIACLPDGLR